MDEIYDDVAAGKMGLHRKGQVRACVRACVRGNVYVLRVCLCVCACMYECMGVFVFIVQRAFVEVGERYHFLTYHVLRF